MFIFSPTFTSHPPLNLQIETQDIWLCVMPLLTDKTCWLGALFNVRCSTMAFLLLVDTLELCLPASCGLKCSCFFPYSELQKRAGQHHGCSARLWDLLQILLWEEIWAKGIRIRTRSRSSEFWSSRTGRKAAAASGGVCVAFSDKIDMNEIHL